MSLLRRIKFTVTLIFILYIILLIRLIFFDVGHTNRQTYFTKREVHIIPFKSTVESILLAQQFYHGPKHTLYYWYLALRNIFGNIALFVPAGALLPVLSKKIGSLKRILILSILTSFFFETLQFLFILGVTDVDDVIYNTIGAFLGYTIYTYLSIWLKRSTSLNNE